MSTIPEEARDASTGKERRICPVKNATETFWRRQPHTLDEHRSTDALPVECDIAIIGTGMSGVATAYYLSLSGAESVQPSIVLLEARQVCSGATGRNGVCVSSCSSSRADRGDIGPYQTEDHFHV